MYDLAQLLLIYYIEQDCSHGDYKATKCWEKGEEFVRVLTTGLSDNWSQVCIKYSILQCSSNHL